MAIAITERDLYFLETRNHILLTADIGGTHVRHRISDLNGNQVSSGKLETNNYDNPISLVNDILRANDQHKNVAAVAFGIAGPCNKDAEEVDIINSKMRKINLREIFDHLSNSGILAFAYLNDLEAQTWGILAGGNNSVDLSSSHQLSDPSNYQLAVIAPGTGLGVGNGFIEDGKITVRQSEGGHSLSLSLDDLKMFEELKDFIEAKTGWDLEAEDVISGRGLENLLAFFVHKYELGRGNPVQYTADQIVKFAKENKFPSTGVMQVYIELLGEFARNLALTFNADRVTLVGHCHKEVDFYQKDDRFMTAFIENARLKEQLRRVRVDIMEPDGLGERGAATYLQQKIIEPRMTGTL